jgi:hypothetical protein
MFLKSHAPRRRGIFVVAIGVFATLALSGAAAGAQTSTPKPTDQNCAVSTARLGSVDVTEFFGIRGGASGFAQNFGQPDAAVVQRCIRLEVDNPAPGDLLPVGGYVMDGFAFDPTLDSSLAPGIRSVQVFLDDPNQGGAIVGDARADSPATTGKGLGVSSARGAAFGDQFANAGFHLALQIPASATGSQHTIFVLASSSTGRVGTIAVPVIVGNLTPASPTRTP